MSSTETPWFPVSTPPVRPGWYKLKSMEDLQRYVHNGCANNFVRPAMVVKRYWSGSGWRWQPHAGGKLVYAAIDEKSVWCGIVEA